MEKHSDDTKPQQESVIRLSGKMTNFCNRDDVSVPQTSLYSLDTENRMHLDLIPGVLKLSSKRFKTTKASGYIMKEFEPAFGYLPTFMVKTDKLKDYIDKYAIVRVSHNLDKLTGQKSITGVIDRYIGNVGDTDAEKELCKIISTAHWSRKIDRSRCFDTSGKYDETIESVKIQELLKLGITFEDQTPDREDISKPSETTNRVTVSVDPEGSKDIDDAISIELIDDTKVLIGIHIADPSSYLIEGSTLDQEVAKRAESVYLKDQTFHMFPEYLSTTVFSLVGDRDNRAFSVLLELTKNTESNEWDITKKTVKKTKIRMDRNMTYEQFQTEHKSDHKMSMLYSIGESLHTKLLNSQKLVTYDSKKMIEIFMVLANCTVAEQMVKICTSVTGLNSHPILIRSQKPSGYEIDIGTLESDGVDKSDTSSLGRLIDEHVKLHMKSAEIRFYSNRHLSSEDDKLNDNAHHSLGLDLYTHFTSPIRRYSDILVHRIMWNLMSYHVKDDRRNDHRNDHQGVRFKLANLNRTDLHQMFVMNHYKQFYKRVYGLENEIKITHHYIDSVGKDPVNRVHTLQGIVLDIIKDQSSGRIDKIKIKCTGLGISDGSELSPKIAKSLSQLFKNTIHTVRIGTDQQIPDNLKMFQPIQYKVCYLARDVRKIRPFL